MNKDHIVILKKIPVDPKHVGALRIHNNPEKHIPHHHEASRGAASPLPYRIFSFILFFAFLINPIGVAYAEEVTPLPDPAPSDTPAPELEPGVTIVVPPGEETGITPPPEPVPSSEGIAEEPSPVVEELSATTTETSSATSTETASSTEMGIEEATSTEEVVGDVGGGGSETSTTTATSTNETASSTDAIDIPAPEPEEPPATNLDREQTPEERAAERAAAEAVMREQIKKEVEAEMRSKCVSYGDDGYYCLDDSSADRVTSERPVEQVVSARDAGGDKEIFLVRTLPEGESRVAITENDVDDEFPNADGELRMIVWQSLVGGRWQIAYKEGTGTIEYLTANQDGNGHPATDGKRIVWQGWSGTHWDIFLAEPETEGVLFVATSTGPLAGIHPGWKITQLSHNPSHDMFPKIAGNFVTWQEHRDERWVVVVYDIATGQSRVIEGDAGGTGEAPTVALIFKERTKEGRVFIRASDLATGERIPLRDDEVPEPAKLPIPEQSGALPLQNGTSSSSTIRPEGEGDGGATPEI